MYEIIIGRNETDRKKFGDKGTFLLGKHYVRMGQTTSLSSNIYMDAVRPHVTFVVGKRGSGKCIAGDTLIALGNGRLAPIQDLANDAAGIMAMDEQFKMMEWPKTSFFKRNVQNLLRIELRSGKEIRLTPEHPLLTIYGWVKAEGLNKGVRIATPRKLDNFGKEEMPEHEVKLLAYLIAEGHLKQGVLFANNDSEIISEFISSLAILDPAADLVKLKKGHYRVYTRNYKTNFTRFEPKYGKGGFVKGCKFSMTKTKIREFLEVHGLKGKLSGEKFIPERIMMLKKEHLSIFLNRLFTCDGSIYKSRHGKGKIWEISYSSKSEKLIRQVQHVLLRFNVVAKLRNKITKINGKKIPSFELVFNGENLLNFIEGIGFFSSKREKQKKAIDETIVIKRNPNVDTIPKSIWNVYRPKSWADVGRAAGYKYPKSFSESQHYSPSRSKLLQIAVTDKNEFAYNLATSDLFWDEIISIEKLTGEFEVYDLTVPNLHNFVANDIIVHNSYTSSAISEGMMMLDPEIRENLSIILFDTMGIFWTMKFENKEDNELLKKWNIPYSQLNVQVYTPIGFYDQFKEKGISDFPFSIKPSELSVNDWLMTFDLQMNDPISILITRSIEKLKENNIDYSLNDMIAEMKKNTVAEQHVKDAAENLFLNAENWGLFDSKGTKFSDLASGGQITVLDVSCYAALSGADSIRSLVIGLVSKKLFEERMSVRRMEEYSKIKSKMTLEEEKTEKLKIPLIWVMVDEAHEFLPLKGRTSATEPLLTLLREGRQPGISLILATQQPGQIHTDVMTQSDIIIAHRLTAKIDIDALGMLMQTYMRENLDKLLAELPDIKGSALIFDDTNERIYPSQIRPKMTWHGGSSPTAIREKEELFELRL